MGKLGKLLRISLFKSLRFNLKYFGLRGLKLPVLVGRNVILKKLGGRVEVADLRTGTVKLGLTDNNFYDRRSVRGVFYNTGVIRFGSGVKVYCGAKLYNKGELSFGDGDKLAQVKIYCKKKISFGKGCIVSWDVLVMDTDHHTIFNSDNEIINEDKEVVIGDEVWVGCNCTLMKGTAIGNRCIIGACSVLSATVPEGVMVSCAPSRPVMKEIHWVR